jgi:endonuclease YncB( thermonuclease family)
MLRSYPVTVLKAVDGDTFDVLVDLGFSLSYKVRIRMLGINTPEMHDKDPVKRERAQRAKTEGKTWESLSCTLIPHGTDKYGRWVSELRKQDGTDYSAHMVLIGLADVAVYEIVDNFSMEQYDAIA